MTPREIKKSFSLIAIITVACNQRTYPDLPINLAHESIKIHSDKSRVIKREQSLIPVDWFSEFAAVNAIINSGTLKDTMQQPKRVVRR